MQDNKTEETLFGLDKGQFGYKARLQAQEKHTGINNIMSWLTAFSRLMAVLLTVEETIKDETAGLAAHQYVILQLHNDLGSNRWLQYDLKYREWAVAKEYGYGVSLTFPYMADVYPKHNQYRGQLGL